MRGKGKVLLLGYGQLNDGSLSSQTVDRCKEAARLFRTCGFLVEVWITVGVWANEKSMAQEMRGILVEEGVPEEDVFIDARGLNTAGELVVFFEHVGEIGPLWVVTSSYHSKRVYYLSSRICAEKGERVRVYSSSKVYQEDADLEGWKMLKAEICPLWLGRLGTWPWPFNRLAWLGANYVRH